MSPSRPTACRDPPAVICALGSFAAHTLLEVGCPYHGPAGAFPCVSGDRSDADVSSRLSPTQSIGQEADLGGVADGDEEIGDPAMLRFLLTVALTFMLSCSGFGPDQVASF